MSEQTLTLTYLGEEQQRLDKFLVERLPQFTRSRLQNLIRDGRVQVDDKVVTKTGFALEGRQEVQVRLPAPEPTRLTPEDIPLDVVFENSDVLVVNKPAGMVVHPAAGHATGTLVHAALAHAPEIEEINEEQRPGVVHRLDKDTSGLILIAKNESAHRWLQNQFKTHQVEKVYLALVDGHPPTPSGRVEAPIGRDAAFRRRMAVVPASKGRRSVTEYETLEFFDEHSLLEVRPLTGRTHQIRIHMAFLGCPITGDRLYGYRRLTLPIRRHFLHATRLSVRLPGEDRPRTFEAPLPPELEKALQSLRGHLPPPAG